MPSLRSPTIGFLLLVVFYLSCVSNEKKTDEPRLSEEEERVFVNAKKEMEIGRSMAGRLLRFYGVYEDRKLVRYLNEVGNYVASQSDFPDRRFMFDILNTDDVNAYACPGGYILITLGALRNAESEAELAAIIAHEIAHIGKEHMLNQLTKMSEKEIENQKKESAKEIIPPQVSVRKRPSAKESAIGSMLAKYVGGSVAGLNALKAAKAGISIIMEKGLGADLEYEADVEGVKYSTGSGYHPYGLPNFLCRIYMNKGFSRDQCYSSKLKNGTNKKNKTKGKQQNKESILDKTHPSIPNRIEKIMAHLDSIDGKKIVGAEGKKRFLKMKKGIPTKG